MYAMYDPSRSNIKEGAIPTKMLDAAAYGIPSVVNENTAMGDYCLENKIGSTAPYGNKEEIAESIKVAHNIEIKTLQHDDKDVFLSVINRLIQFNPSILSMFRLDSDTNCLRYLL